MATLENLSKEEKIALEELRIKMKTVLTPEKYEDDILLYRFLKARNFDVNKAEAMLRKQITYRKAQQLDTILETFKPKEVFTKYFLGTYLGDDNEGYPVRFIEAGKLDPGEIKRCFKYNNYWKHWLWSLETDLERCREISLKTGKQVWKSIYICDMSDLEFSNVCHSISLNYARMAAEAIQDYYPEAVHKMIYINSPTYFVVVYNLFKTILAQETLKKIQVFGKTGWKEYLLKTMDADILPAFLGGNRTDPDGNPMCYTLGCNSGKIPKTCSIPSEEMTLQNDAEAKHIKLQAKSTHKVFVKVYECGSIIEWEFEVCGKDIGFAFYFKESDNDEEQKEILPMCRYETLFGTHDDSYKCQLTGTYVIVFDNRYSWLKAKEILYKVKVIKPDKS